MSRGVDVGLEEDPVSVWGTAQLRPDHRWLLDEDVPPSVSVVCGHTHMPFVRQTVRRSALPGVEQQVKKGVPGALPAGVGHAMSRTDQPRWRWDGTPRPQA